MRDRRQSDREFEKIRRAVAAQSDAWLCGSLREVPHRKWIEIENGLRMAIGITAHRAASRIEELRERIVMLETAPNQAKRVITPVFIICNAYESGFGHGRELDNLPNPYTKGSEEHEAYVIGYQEGEQRRRNNGSTVYCSTGDHESCMNGECLCKCHAPMSASIQLNKETIAAMQSGK